MAHYIGTLHSFKIHLDFVCRFPFRFNSLGNNLNNILCINLNLNDTLNNCSSNFIFVYIKADLMINSINLRIKCIFNYSMKMSTLNRQHNSEFDSLVNIHLSKHSLILLDFWNHQNFELIRTTFQHN